MAVPKENIIVICNENIMDLVATVVSQNELLIRIKEELQAKGSLLYESVDSEIMKAVETLERVNERTEQSISEHR